MIGAIITFGISLAAIIVLFILKHIEIKKSYIVAPTMRAAADRSALRCKALLRDLEMHVEQLPPRATKAFRSGLAVAAATFGSIAHRVGKESHRLADVVSHKHNFERSETRSEFLKQVTEHKNGNTIRPPLDTRH